MKKYEPENPEFSTSINITETTDRAHADIINDPLKQLHQNTLKLKQMIDNGEVGGSTATEEEVKELAEDLMSESGGGVLPDTATDEDIEELIDDLDDL